MNTYGLIKHLVINEEHEKFLELLMGFVCLVAYPGITKDKEALKKVTEDKLEVIANVLDSELDSDFLYRAYGVTE